MKYVIKNNYDYEYIINKSKFIVCLRYLSKIDDVELELNKIKNEYKGATHYCYAYILDGNIKCSDDKEPSGTAGLPILNVLKQKEVNNILCVVVRYFGGIKLGTGGLVRAYSNTVSESISKVELIEKVNYKEIKISFDYSLLKNVEYILKDVLIMSKDFNDNVVFELKIDEKIYDEIISKLNSLNIKNM